MRLVPVAIAVLTVAGILPECSTEVEPTFEPISIPEATPEASAPATRASTPSPVPDLSSPASVTVTFRLSVEGVEVPDDLVVSLETDVWGDGRGVVAYLCSYRGGYPVCADGESYEVAVELAPGTPVVYRFWQELNANGEKWVFDEGETRVGTSDRLIWASLNFGTYLPS